MRRAFFRFGAAAFVLLAWLRYCSHPRARVECDIDFVVYRSLSRLSTCDDHDNDMATDATVARDSAFLTQYPVPPVPISSIKEYVELCGGTRPIEKVLIANNGIAAVKEIRSVRSWAFHVTGNARAVQFVVMATPDDLKVSSSASARTSSHRFAILINLHFDFDRDFDSMQ